MPSVSGNRLLAETTLKSLTSAPRRTGKAEASNRLSSPVPERPAVRFAQNGSRPIPTGLTTPTPGNHDASHTDSNTNAACSAPNPKQFATAHPPFVPAPEICRGQPDLNRRRGREQVAQMGLRPYHGVLIQPQAVQRDFVAPFGTPPLIACENGRAPGKRRERIAPTRTFHIGLRRRGVNAGGGRGFASRPLPIVRRRFLHLPTPGTPRPLPARSPSRFAATIRIRPVAPEPETTSSGFLRRTRRPRRRGRRPAGRPRTRRQRRGPPGLPTAYRPRWDRECPQKSIRNRSAYSREF